MDPFHYDPSRLRVSKKNSDQFFLIKNQVLCSKNQDLSSDFKIDEQRNQLALYRLFFGAGTNETT